MKLKWEWTIPNILSLVRIALIPVFAVLYIMSARQPELLWWSVAVLAASGLTDILDGFIARTFQQISEIGKILDPLADKLTQVTVVICLAVNMPRLWPLVIICFFKELFQAIGACMLLFGKSSHVQPSKWYGKVSTSAFYAVMASFVVFPLAPDTPLLFGWNMPLWLFITLALIVSVLMLFSFIQYTRLFFHILCGQPSEKTPVKGDTEL